MEMSKDTVTRVVLADDHDIVRQGLRRLLDRAPEIEVVGEASDGLEALQYVEELEPDVLLLDIEMPVLDGIEVARRLSEAHANVSILVLSAYDDREYIRSLLEIGVSGYLVKGEAPGKIVEAVRSVARGQKGWVSPQVRKKLEKMQEAAYKQNNLTFRELEILRLLAAGKTEEEVAAQMKMQAAELKSASEHLMQKLGTDSVEQAIEVAVREGWVNRP